MIRVTRVIDVDDYGDVTVSADAENSDLLRITVPELTVQITYKEAMDIAQSLLAAAAEMYCEEEF